MTEFINDNFILHNETARKLYHEYAAEMPIIDYHNHLNPEEIFEDKMYGLEGTTISGVPCVPTEYPRS